MTALLALLAALGVGLVFGLPVPQVHDEFAYLLAADTFASGRIANPTHPFWTHFETFHVIHVPTYVAKYPPAQGLVLALGQVLVGHPIAGVWISVTLMTAAITWMLFAWFPPRWALIGSGLVLVQIVLGSYWAQSYWGGAVAALGGALLYGAFPRLRERPKMRDASLLGVGVGLLAASRPFEGLIVTIPVAILLFLSFIRGTDAFRRQLLHALLPAAAIVTLALGSLGYTNWRSTGSAVRMPYSVHEATYSAAPTFLWQRPTRGPEYRHREMAAFWTIWEREAHEALRVPERFLRSIPTRMAALLSLYLGWAAIAMLVLPIAIRSAQMRLAMLVSGLLLAGIMATKAAFPHYAAPAAGLFYVVATGCLQRIGQIRPRWLGAGAVSLLLVLTLQQRLAALSDGRAGPLANPLPAFGAQRDSLLDELEAMPGRDLVIVRYVRSPSYHEEWIYNRADIDRAEVVWARDMGTDANDRLRGYFADRHVWLLTVDGRSIRILPVSTTATPPGT